MEILQKLSIFIGLLGSGGLIGLLIWLWRSGKYFGALDEKLKILPKLESHVNQITNAIVEIQTHMSSRGYTISQRIAVTNASPTTLTEYGEQLMQESGFYKIVEQNKNTLIDLVRARNPNSNYDIQEFSFRVLKELVASNSPMIFPLKNYAFQKGLMLDIILQAAGIVLRDTIMKDLKFEDQTLESRG